MKLEELTQSRISEIQQHSEIEKVKTVIEDQQDASRRNLTYAQYIRLKDQNSLLVDMLTKSNIKLFAASKWLLDAHEVPISSTGLRKYLRRQLAENKIDSIELHEALKRCKKGAK